MDGNVPVLPDVRPITYGNLLKRLGKGSNQDRNKAFLNGLRVYLCHRLDDDAAEGLASSGAEYLTAIGQTPNKRAALKHLRTVITELPADPFGDILWRTILAWRKNGGTTRNLAERIGIPATLLSSYLYSGKPPSKKLLEPLRKLEILFEYAPGFLTNHVSHWRTIAYTFQDQYFDLSNPFYKWDFTKKHKRSLGPRITSQFRAYLDYKVEAGSPPSVTLPDGSRRELRRSTAWTRSIRHLPNKKQFVEWNDCPSAFMAIGDVATLYDFAVQKYDVRADTLALVLDIDLLEDWLRYDMRLRGRFHSGHASKISTITTLLHPRHGYVVQVPEIFLPEARDLGMDVSEATWAEFVKYRYDLARSLARRLVPNRPVRIRAQRSRDKKRKLTQLLSHEDAYRTFVFPTLIRMQLERPPENAPEVIRLDFELKVLTFALFAACPLRMTNWSNAEWGKHLRKQEGEWWVHVPLEEQKNRRVLDGDLRVVLPGWASQVVENYHTEIVPMLAKKNLVGGTYVLASWATGRSKVTELGTFDRIFAVQQIYMSIQSRLASMTKQLWNLAISPHDWRDICATDYLNKHPGEILTVATVLNDKPETVLREYAKPDSARLSRAAARHMESDYRSVLSSFGLSRGELARLGGLGF